MQKFYVDLGLSDPEDADLQMWLAHNQIELKVLVTLNQKCDQVCRLIGTRRSLWNFIDDIYAFDEEAEAILLKQKVSPL